MKRDGNGETSGQQRGVGELFGWQSQRAPSQARARFSSILIAPPYVRLSRTYPSHRRYKTWMYEVTG